MGIEDGMSDHNQRFPGTKWGKVIFVKPGFYIQRKLGALAINARVQPAEIYAKSCTPL
jgi:hypothetical protein